MSDTQILAAALSAVIANPNVGLMLIPEYADHLPRFRELWRQSYGLGKDTFLTGAEGRKAKCRSCIIERLRKLQYKYA